MQVKSTSDHDRQLSSEETERSNTTEPEVDKEETIRVSENERLSPISTTRLAELQQQLALQRARSCMSMESSGSSNLSTSSSSNNDLPIIRNHQGVGLGYHGKPLPDIPGNLEEKAMQTTLDRFLRRKQHISTGNTPPKLSVPRQLSFSFQPGDDANILSPRIERDRAKRQTLDDHLDQVSMKDKPSKSITLVDQASQQVSNQLAKQTSLQSNTRPRLGQRTHVSKDLQDYDGMTREDSTNSVITAVRDNSGRSSVANDSHNSPHVGRPRLDRNIGGSSNDAGIWRPLPRSPSEFHNL